MIRMLSTTGRPSTALDLRLPVPDSHTFAVLGGTETYANAAGDASLEDVAEGTEFVIDLA
jgi:hypothetical protein